MTSTLNNKEQDMRQKLTHIVQLAGNKALSMQQEITRLPVQNKGAQGRDIATAADTSTQTMIIEYLRRTYPDVPILGEEGNESLKVMMAKLKSRRLFILDPIDGTSNFFAQSKNWGTMLSYIEDGKPVIGIIHLPAHGMTYSGEKGKGVYRNLQRLKPASLKPTLEQSIIGMEFGYWLDEKRYRQQWAITAKSKNIHASASAAVGLAGLIDGVTNAYLNLHTPTQGACIWDFAAGAILFAESTGLSVDEVVCNPDGSPINWTELRMEAVFSHPSLKQELITTMAQAI